MNTAKCKSVNQKINIVTDIIISPAKRSVGAVKHMGKTKNWGNFVASKMAVK